MIECKRSHDQNRGETFGQIFGRNVSRIFDFGSFSAKYLVNADRHVDRRTLDVNLRNLSCKPTLYYMEEENTRGQGPRVNAPIQPTDRRRKTSLVAGFRDKFGSCQTI